MSATSAIRHDGVLNTRAIPIGSRYRAAHDKAMTGNEDNEYTTREDILMCMEELSLQPKQAKAMLKSPCPLKDVYEEFRDRETGYMDTIRESIEAEADRCIHKEKQRASRADR